MAKTTKRSRLNPKQRQLMALVKEFKSNSGKANGLDYLVDAFEYSVTEDVSITPVVNAWKENKDSIAKDGSVDRFFEFLCKIKRITVGNSSYGGFQILWDKKESDFLSSFQPTEEINEIVKEMVANQNTAAELRAERKDTSSWFTPGWPYWEIFHETFAEVGNPIQVIGAHVNGLYPENYRDDPDVCFHATDERYLLTRTEKRFLSSITEDLIELRKDDPSELLKIVVFGRCAVEDDYHTHPKYQTPDETDWKRVTNELNKWIQVAGESSQPVFLSILYAVLEFGQNQYLGSGGEDGLEFLLECSVGRWAPPAIPIEALSELLAICDLADVSAETLIPLYDQILDAQKELASDGRCLFTVRDAAMIYDFTPRDLELLERLPAAVLLAQLEAFFYGGCLDIWNENSEPPEFDLEYGLLIKACIRDRLYSLAQALMAFWMVAGALRSEAVITSWNSKVELIAELRDKPGFQMVQRSLVLLYSYAKEDKNSFTTALLDAYVDKQAVEEEEKIEKPKWERHVTHIYTEPPSFIIEEKIKERLGDTFEVLHPKSKRILVDAHKKLFKLQPEMQFGMIKNWGNISAEFIKLFEIELDEKLRDIYQDQSYREFKERRKEQYVKKPGIGHYLWMLKDYRHLAKSLQEEIDFSLSIQHDRGTIRELDKVISQYRNPGFHTGIVPAAKVLEVTEILYGDSDLIGRFMRGMMPKINRIRVEKES